MVALAFLFMDGASAQIPTSSAEIRRRPADPSRAELVRSDQVFRDMVGCVIGRAASRTRNLLDTIPGTPEEGRILFSFDSRMQSCFDNYRLGGDAMSFPSNLFRGVTAEVYYRREFPTGITSATEIAAETMTAWAGPRLADGRATQSEMLHAMARCVILRQPAAVAAMLRTVPISDEERVAMRALSPELSACLDSGIEFTASPQSLRGLLAEAALHYAEALRTGFALVGRGSVGSE
jgi:hypothetical protein